MTKIISVNAGSSSLKFQLFEMPEEKVLTSGVFERIGLDEGIFTIKVNGEKKVVKEPIPDHTKAVEMLLNALVEYKIVDHLDEIKGAGHRAVHGGELFTESVKVDDEVAKKFESLSDLAPLHNPAGLVGYHAFKEALPNCIHTFVFDTAFHSTMKPDTFLYPIPYEYYEKYQIRRYGFHGTSHKYVSQRCAELMNKNVEDLKIITCHLGNGASITAVDGGKSINTSMGFTPLAGVMMGTRCGDIDPAIVTYLQKKEGLSAAEVEDIMNKHSGMLGVSGISSDGRDVEDAAKEGNERAILTESIFANRVASFIGSYYVQLGGLDAIVFTGGIGENDGNMRKRIIDRVKVIGAQLDDAKNDGVRGVEKCLSTDDSKVAIWLIPTNEELMIARDAYRFVKE
ncbi:acetate/propionate family kinase [Merdibacter massiliensis]|uniref:acetate/propionate family kinase n=1 Tax=Merdibacter massiliensis TaxID=1871030 RepID=UPI00096AC47A|nr:acetate kinase [Merdibacter massiliensis]